MKFRSRSILAAAIALASQGALSADTYLNVFLDSAPMTGLDVVLNGESIGTTDSRGASSSFISAGEHTIQLYRDGVFLTEVDYVTQTDQDAEISITFTESRSKPEVTVSLYSADDSQVKGLVGGIITNQNDVPVAGATVSSADGTAEVLTDADGAYELALPRGEQDLVITHPDYSKKILDKIMILADTGAVVSTRLSKPIKNQITIDIPTITGPIEEVLTLGSYKPNDSSLGLERFSTEVVDAIDVETMARFGDGNIAAALTRLAGVAVTGGQYANVRGLDGRYISSSLNGFVMPTTDPLTRDVQLDIFPSGILENIQVQKSYSANLLGSTTGGALQIKTKGLPDERGGKFSLKVGANTEITGNQILTHTGSTTDWTTYDSGFRTLSPSVLRVTENGLEDLSINDSGDEGTFTAVTAPAFAVAFEDNYNVKSKKAVPEFDIGLSFGDISDSGLIGYYASLGYSYGTSARLDAQLTDPTGTIGSYERSTETFALDGYFVLGSQFRNEDEVLSKTIFLRTSDFETQVLSGIDNEDNQRDRTYLQWTERQFISQQFEGHHIFDFDFQSHELNWGLAFSNTDFHQPDRREYEYLSGFLIQNGLERRWLEMVEDSVDFRVDYTAPFQITSSIVSEIKIGGLISDKERSTEQFRFGWRNGRGPLAGETIRIEQDLEEVFAYQQFALDTYRLDVKTTVTDSFDSEESVVAYFLDTSTEFGDSFVIDLGVRQETFEQELTYPNDSNDRFGGSLLEVDSLLPAVNLTFIPHDDWQFKVAASETVSYPGVIEKSLARMFDLDSRPFFGCPTCEESQIQNLDFRIEYYFSDEESISLALFNKEIDAPMERAVVDASGSVNSGYTFRQSESATLNGAEIDGKLNLFDNGVWLGFVSGNLTYIESEVTLDDESLRLEGASSQGRELQGQAPWLANVQFGLDHFPTEQKVTLLLNYFDDRIDIVLRQPRAAFVEVGRTELNLNYEARLSDSILLKAQFKNLLDEAVEYSINGRVVESYNEGVEYSVELGWEF